MQEHWTIISILGRALNAAVVFHLQMSSKSTWMNMKILLLMPLHSLRDLKSYFLRRKYRIIRDSNVLFVQGYLIDSTLCKDMWPYIRVSIFWQKQNYKTLVFVWWYKNYFVPTLPKLIATYSFKQIIANQIHSHFI